MDDVPDVEKRRRNNEMLAVQTEINLANNRTLLGETVEVLVEGPSKRAIRLQESEQGRGEEVESTPSDRGQLVGRTRGDQIVVVGQNGLKDKARIRAVKGDGLLIPAKPDTVKKS